MIPLLSDDDSECVKLSFENDSKLSSSTLVPSNFAFNAVTISPTLKSI